MENRNEHKEALDRLARYIAGELEPEEVSGVENWIRTSEENKKTFDDFKQVWQSMDRIKPMAGTDLETEWTILKEKVGLEARTLPLHPHSRNRHRYQTIYRIAASFALLAVVTLSLFLLYRSREVTTLTSAEEVRDVVLPDGSLVTLNKNSSLSYTRKFGIKERRIRFTGEAYFEITPDASRKFFVDTEEIQVEVLGTTFHLTSGKNQPLTELIVMSGVVSFYHSPDQKLILESGEKGSYSPDQSIPVKTANTDLNHLAWKNKKLFFENASLDYVIHTLNKTYSVEIKILNESIKKCQITVQFDNQDLESILEVLKATLNLSTTAGQGQILIEGEGC